MKFDVLIVGDLRFPGGTSTSAASDITALAQAGYTVGLMPVAGTILRFPHPLNKTIQKVVQQGQAVLVPYDTPVKARLCLLHHPQVFAAYPKDRWNITADLFHLIVHHPPVDGFGNANYDVAQIDRILTDLCGRVAWAPVGPQVRKAFARIANCPELTPDDWLNILDPDDFALERSGFLSAKPVVGRHSRPDPQKWPETRERFLRAYPDSDQITVRLMGYGAEQDDVVGQRPPNWQILPFDAAPVRSFLGSIDFFVYFHSDIWVEAFGRSVLEAIASGAVAILPGYFRPLFQDAAVYCTPDQVAQVVQTLHRNPVEYARQSARGVAFVREHFGLDHGAERVRRLIGPPEGAKLPAPAGKGANGKILFLTSNGIGMGHLTRALAVARRLPDHITPVMVSMSKAFGVSALDGIDCEYIPYHRSIGLKYNHWSSYLTREITELLGHHQPRIFVFDGNVPYPGMTDAFDTFPQMWKVWLRRAMWAPGAGSNHIKQRPMFDAVIEPGEVAGVMDRGLTREDRDKTVMVPPIRYLDRDEALSRDEARAHLGLPEGDVAVLLQLGSENNFDLSAVRQQVFTKLLGRPGLSVVNAEWLIRNDSTALPPGVGQIREFPISKFLAAFDFAVSTAGYNSYHENIYAALPTIFVANENPEQDEQWLRAYYAELKGLALASRLFNPHALDRALDRMLIADQRALIRAACQALDMGSGAANAALFLANQAFIRR